MNLVSSPNLTHPTWSRFFFTLALALYREHAFLDLDGEILIAKTRDGNGDPSQRNKAQRQARTAAL